MPETDVQKTTSGYNQKQMAKLSQNQAGFIPMLLTILAVVVAVIVLVFLRLAHAGH